MNSLEKRKLIQPIKANLDNIMSRYNDEHDFLFTFDVSTSFCGLEEYGDDEDTITYRIRFNEDKIKTHIEKLADILFNTGIRLDEVKLMFTNQVREDIFKYIKHNFHPDYVKVEITDFLCEFHNYTDIHRSYIAITIDVN